MKASIVSLTTLGLVAAIAATSSNRPKAPLIVHEWGTITTHHAPDGTPRGRLNHIRSSDTLPQFVHRFDPPATSKDPNLSLVKTAYVAGRPDVTMRLETPVIYFYRRPGVTSVPPFEVSVQFRGGILNEFYPNAEASVAPTVEGDSRAPALTPSWNGEKLDNYVVGRLLWRAVTLGNSVPLTRTASQVWLAPRAVHASGVLSGGESERYLFYRGVAHLDAVVQTRLTTDVRIFAPRELQWMRSPTMQIANSWLVDVLPNGSAAFREQGALTISKAAPSQELARIPLFAKQDYAPTRLADLRQAMKRALIAAGLYEEEADAMLETWKESYFQTPGLRVFYLVPNEWTQYFLPLQISLPHELTRVLVGRVDIERTESN